MRVDRKIVEKKSCGVNTHGPFERQREREHPRRGDFTPTGLLPFAFQTSLILPSRVPWVPFAYSDQ